MVKALSVAFYYVNTIHTESAHLRPGSRQKPLNATEFLVAVTSGTLTKLAPPKGSPASEPLAASTTMLLLYNHGPTAHSAADGVG